MATFFMKDKEELNLKATFENLMNQANAIQKLCADDIVPMSDVVVAKDLKLNGMDMTDFARGELCGKLHIPSRYISRCVEEHREDLAAENLREWMKEDTRKIMLRQYDGHIRGVMSGSYSRYDTPEILESVKEVFGDDRFKIKGSFLNEERMHIRFVEDKQLPIDGEDLFAGVTLDSSDIGRSGLAVKFFIYKKVCTNGLTVSKSSAKMFTQKHIGIDHEDFKSSLEDGLAKFDDIRDQVTEMIQETSKIPLPEDIEDLAKKVKEKTLLSDDDIEEVFDLAVNRYTPTQWGLINGITEIAQKFSLERRLALEEIAGSMLA